MKLRAILMMGSLSLGSCTSQTQSSDQSSEALAAAKVKLCADGTTSKGNKPCPTPTPTPTPTTTAVDTPSPDGLMGEVAIADNFTTNTGIEPTPYPAGIGGGIPAQSADEVSAFRFNCSAGQLLRDDPIALPGQPGASHLHQFIGNTAANAGSTYASLRTTGGSTCDNRGQPYALNRSSYWMPAMLDGAGHVVRPDTVLVYYKRLPASSPLCGAPDATHSGICTDMPDGIKFIFGYNMKTMSGGPADTSGRDYWAMNFTCVDHDKQPVSAAPGTYHTIAAAAQAGCPMGQWLKVSLDGPTCWDGKNLDTADHRSHVVYAPQTTCPADHPYLLPTVGYQWFFTTDANFVAGRWRLSSDDMMAQMGMPVTPGATLHMDYFEGWSPVAKATWQAHCINQHLTCSNGDLGNGTELKNAGTPAGGFSIQPLIAVP